MVDTYRNLAATNRSLITGAAFAMLVSPLATGSAMAASIDSVGALMQQSHNQFESIINLISMVSYIVATTLTIQVLNRATQYTGTSGQVKLSGLFMRAGGAAAFFNLPSVIKLLNQVLFADNDSRNVALNGKLAGVSGEGLDVSLVTMIKDITPGLTILVGLIAFISGALAICSALLALADTNYANNNTSKPALLARLGVGSALIAFAPTVTTILGTLFDTTAGAATASLAYSKDAMDAATATRVDNVLNAVFVWLGLIGLMSILRGLWVLKASLEGGGQKGMTAPLTQLIAGGMLVNIVPTIHLIEKTLAVNVIT